MKTRASILPLVVVALSLLSAGQYAWFKMVEPGRNKKVADQSALVAAEASRQAETAKQEAAAAQKAAAESSLTHQKERALHEQIDQNAAGFLEGAKIAIQSDPNPSDTDMVALGLIDSAGTALGQPLTPQQCEVWKKTVAGLIAKNAEAQAKLAQLTKEAAEVRAQLGEVRARAEAADGHVVTLTQQLATTNQQLAESTGKTAELTMRNKLWADGEQTWWGRAKAAAALAALLVLTILGISLKCRGLSQTVKSVESTATDSVALIEHVKSEVARGVTKTEDLEKSIEAWFGTDDAAKKAFQKFQSNLRVI